MARKDCPKCKGEGRVREKDGTIHTCWACLAVEDQHGNPKDNNLKL